MKNPILLIAGATLLAGAQAASDVHWGYSGPEGPEHWGELSPEYRVCSEGKNQSPIDLSGFIEADLQPIAFTYQPGGGEVLNNGHTIQINYAPGSQIAVGGHEFDLKQFHFHAPSENHIEGNFYPLEGHLVHADKDGNLAVVAVMFEEGANNKALEEAWAKMPTKAGEKHTLSAPVDATGILPNHRDYYRFNGSLTTPPCSEGVWWLVMKEPIAASKEQIAKFAKVMQHPTNRPVQPVNARPVLK